MLTTEQLQSGFTLGDWEVLPNRGVLCRGDDEIHPEPKVLAVLLALARRDGDLVTKQELIDEVWEGRAFGDEPIQRCIALLRKHFADSRPYQYIETLQRRGYRLLQRVKLRAEQDDRIARAPAVRHGTRRWGMVTAVVIAGLVAVAVPRWWPFHKEPAVQSLAILPLDNLSGNAANQYIGEGIKNTLVYRLSELQDFAIKNIRERPAGDPSEIAARLKVESVLVGALQVQNDILKVTWQIINGEDGVTLRAGEVTGDLSGVFALQEELAQDVRDDLAGSATPQLSARAEPKSEAYISFMRGMFLFERRGEAGNLEAAMRLFQESIALDKDFGPAYLSLASGYELLPDYRDRPLDEMLNLAIATVEAGVRVDPGIEDAAASIYGFYFHQQKRWRESEKAHLRAVNAVPANANSFNWYSRMLSSVGRRDDAVRWALAAESIAPDNPIVNSRIALAYLWLGDTQKADDYFQRAGDLGAGGRNQLLGYALLLLRLGNFEQAQDLAVKGSVAENVPADWVEPVFAGFANSAHRERGLAALNRQWENGKLGAAVVLIARTMLGDVEGAMDIAQRLKQPGEIFEMDLLFIDELEPLRLHPGFIPLMQELGVVDYWESVGCQWEVSQVKCAAD